MAWKFLQADNGKKIYKIKRDSGHIIDIEVPKEHQGDIAAAAYVQAVLDAYDLALDNPAKKPNIFKRMFSKKE